jgi:hypothetical protein
VQAVQPLVEKASDGDGVEMNQSRESHSNSSTGSAFKRARAPSSVAGANGSLVSAHAKHGMKPIGMWKNQVLHFTLFYF